ncbi:MAG: UDP-N-acetylmuramoyl-L-alanine--D-glutamate ligase [Spirochaetaceae bacterium]|jgi:UDP-N-acetylmuramoylalanine--D-glutamate ligase|nr:UDP-N-acetylmuramoyl-L-alanine--D-glutamate ligase [Spirochaetaceae bacterium]
MESPFAHVYPPGAAFASLKDIEGKKVTVMGIGLNGGGEESIRFFLRHGALVTATDTKGEGELLPTLDALRAAPGSERLRFVLGRHEGADFSGADVVIKNPVVKYEGNDYLSRARRVETDVSVFLGLTKAPVIAVTGSKGKSTTASAIHHGLCGAGFSAFLGGNITVSPLSFLEKTTGDTPVVLELSSWQLRDLRGRGLLRPRAAVITTIVGDHQNWYSSMGDYVADKALIYADQGPRDWTICVAGPWGDVFASESPARVIQVDPAAAAREPPLAPLLPGAHNRLNLRLASQALAAAGIPAGTIEGVFALWGGIPHRLEWFLSWDSPAGGKAAFYNDTAATVPEAASAALCAFEKPVYLIAGGTDKALDFTPLADALAGLRDTPGFRPVFLLPGTGTEKLLPLLEARRVPVEGPFGSIGALLERLRSLLQNEGGDCAVVFSPGAASFGMFKNEFHRGDVFKEDARAVFGSTTLF